jgi:chromosome segregation ATPase
MMIIIVVLTLLLAVAAICVITLAITKATTENKLEERQASYDSLQVEYQALLRSSDGTTSDELQASLTEVTAEKDKLQASLTEVTAEKEELQAENETLKARGNSSSSDKAKITELTQQLTTRTAERDQARSERDQAIASANTTISNLNKEIERLKASGGNTADLNRQIRELTRERDDAIARLNEERIRHSNELTALNELIVSLQKQLLEYEGYQPIN